MESAFDVARWFLGENRKRIENVDYEDSEHEDVEYITNLKLQKLLYYAQGSYLAMFDEPLFEESIEAWRHGPVVPQVYHKYKHFGSNGINEPDEDYNTNFDMKTESLLREVYDTFGIYSAWKLRDMTHQETPWKETKINNVIDLGSIKTYFQENYIED